MFEMVLVVIRMALVSLLDVMVMVKKFKVEILAI
jgi:hypothetical protein